MVDETRTKCGRNGRNGDLVHECSFIIPFKIDTCIQCISSAIDLNSYFVRKNDGVPFGDFANCQLEYLDHFSFSKVLEIIEQIFSKSTEN
jgi:hypothetical protein